MERYIPERKHNRNRKNNGIEPGVYTAVVESVVYSPGFVKGQAIDVVYKVDVDGQIVEHPERYLIADRYSSRTQEFERLLDSLGVERYEDFVGFEFELTFAYEVKKGKAWCNVVERKLINKV